jgi:hypothetical protein
VNKKQDVKIIILFIFIGLLLFGVVGYKGYNDFFKDKSVTKKLISLDLYGYSLKERDNALYKNNFKGLEKILNEEPINYEEYAKSISKLFIIDLFTLNNKLAGTDIGGLDYVHKDLRENFTENMGATLYKNVKNNLDGNRKQKLPEVASVEVSDVFETKYTYSKTEYEAYLITLNWTYTTENDYQKKIKLTLIKDNNKLFIVKGEQ